MTVHPRTTSHAYIVAQYFDIPRGVAVCVARPATGGIGARKALALTRAKMQTPMAHLGRIRRWHQMQDDTRQCCLVGNELPSWKKAQRLLRRRSLCGLGSWLVRSRIPVKSSKAIAACVAWAVSTSCLEIQ